MSQGLSKKEWIPLPVAVPEGSPRKCPGLERAIAIEPENGKKRAYYNFFESTLKILCELVRAESLIYTPKENDDLPDFFIWE